MHDYLPLPSSCKGQCPLMTPPSTLGWEPDGLVWTFLLLVLRFIDRDRQAALMATESERSGVCEHSRLPVAVCTTATIRWWVLTAAVTSCARLCSCVDFGHARVRCSQPAAGSWMLLGWGREMRCLVFLAGGRSPAVVRVT